MIETWIPAFAGMTEKIEIASVVLLLRNDKNNRRAQCIVPLPLHRQASRLSFLLQKVACPLFLFLKPIFLLFHKMEKKVS